MYGLLRMAIAFPSNALGVCGIVFKGRFIERLLEAELGLHNMTRYNILLAPFHKFAKLGNAHGTENEERGS